VDEQRKLIALTIWWCEGTKPREDKRWVNSVLYPIEVTNSDFRIIRIFIDFLTKDLGISINKLNGQVHLHEDDNIQELETYWSSILNIPISQFNKTIIKGKGNKPGKNKGTFKLRLYDKVLYLQLVEMLEKYIAIV